MYSDINDTYVKGIIYSRDPSRLKIIDDQRVIFQGNHANHELTLKNGKWICDCQFYKRLAGIEKIRFDAFCPHIIAIEKQLSSSYLVMKDYFQIKINSEV